MTTVLLATDGSELATAAMKKAVSLLGKDHTFVTLAVVPPAYVPTASVSPMETHPTIVDAALEKRLEAEQRQESAADVDHLESVLGIDAEQLVESGDPGATICEVAQRVSADLVVVGSHGHGWLQRVLLGSVSTHVLSHAPCPVLVIRSEDVAED